MTGRARRGRRRTARTDVPRPPTHGVAVAGEEIVGISGTSGGAINALITWTCLIRGRTDDVDLLARR
jgi:hypothetical protein